MKKIFRDLGQAIVLEKVEDKKTGKEFYEYFDIMDI
jgi:hypothetical protein